MIFGFFYYSGVLAWTLLITISVTVSAPFVKGAICASIITHFERIRLSRLPRHEVAPSGAVLKIHLNEFWWTNFHKGSIKLVRQHYQKLRESSTDVTA